MTDSEADRTKQPTDVEHQTAEKQGEERVLAAEKSDLDADDDSAHQLALAKNAGVMKLFAEHEDLRWRLETIQSAGRPSGSQRVLRLRAALLVTMLGDARFYEWCDAKRVLPVTSLARLEAWHVFHPGFDITVARHPLHILSTFKYVPFSDMRQILWQRQIA